MTKQNDTRTSQTTHGKCMYTIWHNHRQPILIEQNNPELGIFRSASGRLWMVTFTFQTTIKTWMCLSFSVLGSFPIYPEYPRMAIMLNIEDFVCPPLAGLFERYTYIYIYRYIVFADTLKIHSSFCVWNNNQQPNNALQQSFKVHIPTMLAIIAIASGKHLQ